MPGLATSARADRHAALTAVRRVQSAAGTARPTVASRGTCARRHRRACPPLPHLRRWMRAVLTALLRSPASEHNATEQPTTPHSRRQWPTYTTALCAHSASNMHGLSQCHRSLTLGRCCAHCKQRCRRFKRGRVPPPATRRVHASEWRWLRAKLDTAGPIPLEWGS